jgi:Spy/CpxP family protein refolding chaperone
MKAHYLGLLILGSSLCLPLQSFSAPRCDNAITCNPLTQQKELQKHHQAKQDLNNMAALMHALNLTIDQDVEIYQIVKKQAPEVKANMETLEKAQSMLRNMALNKQYDETVAKMLAQTIADSTANLAVLQAQREYELFSMLSPEQADHYNQLIAELSN